MRRATSNHFVCGYFAMPGSALLIRSAMQRSTGQIMIVIRIMEPETRDPIASNTPISEAQVLLGFRQEGGEWEEGREERGEEG